MADVAQQSGIFSSFMYGSEGTTPGTAVAPQHRVSAESITATDDPAVIEFMVMRQSRNVIGPTRAGIHKVMAGVSAPLLVNQLGPLFAYGIGFDSLVPTAGGTNELLAANAAVGDTSVQIATTNLAGLIGSYTNSVVGTWVTFTGTNVTSEVHYVVATSVSGANTVLQFDSKVGQALSTTAPTSGTAAGVMLAGNQHIITENPPTGANGNRLTTITGYTQFASLYEWEMPQMLVGKFDIRGDTKTVKTSFSFEGGSLPIVNSPVTAFTTPASDHNDIPLIMMDGGLITNFSPTSGLLMHNRVLSLDWTFDNGVEMREYGGGVQKTAYNLPGERRQKLTWSEDAGQNDATPDIYTNYVLTQTPTPSFLKFTGQGVAAGTYTGVYFPSCIVNKYDPVTAMNAPVGYHGEMTPLEDSTTGVSVKVAIINNATAVY